jgi:putative membrane protein
LRRSWNPWRVATGLVMAGWAGLFWFLVATGRTPLYLSSRTAWVAPLGAILLTVAAAGRLLSARSARPKPIAPRQAWGLALLLFPVVVLLALPPSTLGAYAAARRSPIGGAYVSGSGDVSSGELSLSDVATALWSPRAMEALAQRAGSRVSFIGFVTHRPGMASDEFLLMRFVVTCCVADALSVQVRVVGAPSGQFAEDQWVRVDGTIYPLGKEVLVKATSVEPVPRPDRPYLEG